MGEVRVSGFSLPRKLSTLSTMKASRRWGTRLWWFGRMWATRPVSNLGKFVLTKNLRSNDNSIAFAAQLQAGIAI
jgi:hypothetical protein